MSSTTSVVDAPSAPSAVGSGSSAPSPLGPQPSLAMPPGTRTDHGELVARLWAFHRRTAPPSRPLVASEAEQPLLIDLARHEVLREGRRLHLTSTELRLLELLVAQAGVLLSHEVLLRHVWGEGYGTESNYLRVYVAQLRKKLGDRADAPRLIETTPGVGYRWIGSPPSVARGAEVAVGA